MLDWLWIRELLTPAPAGGAGASTAVKLTPGTEVKVAAGCNASPCFVCELREVIAQALRRDPRLDEDLRRAAEAREKKKKQRAKAAKQGSAAPPVAEEAAPVPRPLELTILGLRGLNSISDDFDDRMVVFCRLPNGAEAKEISAAAAPLLDPLEKAAAQVKQSVRVVSCSGAPWLAGLFTVTTDAGLQRRMEDIRGALDKTKQQIDANTKKGDEARKRKKQVEETELPQAKSKLDTANQALKSAQSDTKNAKSKLDQALKSSKKDRAEVKQLQDDLAAKRKAELEKRKGVGEASRLVGRLTAEKAHLEKITRILEQAGKKLEAQKAKREKEIADLDRTMVHVSEGEEGWTAEGRAMMLPGHYRDTYAYFIHHSGGELFASDTSLTALTVGYIPGLRLYSGRYVHANPGQFLGKDLQVGELKSSGGSRKFLTEEAKLLVEKQGKSVSASVRLSTGELIALQDADVVLLHQQIGGTNIHRAHNAVLAADGTLHGDSMTKVHDWSWGCQTYPDWKEFNFFIRLCAVAKRWQCASAFHVKAGPDCAVLEAASGEARSPGEEALVTRFGKDFVDRAGDVNRGKKDAAIKEKQARISELTWTDEDQKALDKLEAAKAEKELPPPEAARLEQLETKRSHKLSDDEQKELAALKVDREKWRREYVRDKTKRLAADYLRICDVRGKCNARFSYTLVEVTQEELQRIDAAFRDPLNTEWKGKLL